MAKSTKRKGSNPKERSVADRQRRDELAALRRADRAERLIVKLSRRLRRAVEDRENEMRALALFFSQRAEHVETMHHETVTT